VILHENATGGIVSAKEVVWILASKCRIAIYPDTSGEVSVFSGQ
jgi:hypothetical protein